MRSRDYRFSLLLLAVGAVLVIAGSWPTWVTANVTVSEGVAPTELVVSGREAAPLVAIGGWVIGAGLLAVLATRTWGRVVVGAVIALAAALAALGSVMFAVTARIAAVPIDAVDVSTRPWWLLTLAGALVSLAIGIRVMLRGRAWSAMGTRYERGGSREPSAWELLDAGEDPTA